MGELSAAAADKLAKEEAPTPFDLVGHLVLAKKTLDQINKTRALMANKTGLQIDEETLREIAATAAAMKAIEGKGSKERASQLMLSGTRSKSFLPQQLTSLHRGRMCYFVGGSRGASRG